MAEDVYNCFIEKTFEFKTFSNMQNCLFTAYVKLINNFWILEKSSLIIDTVAFLLTAIYECLHVPGDKEYSKTDFLSSWDCGFIWGWEMATEQVIPIQCGTVVLVSYGYHNKVLHTAHWAA